MEEICVVMSYSFDHPSSGEEKKFKFAFVSVVAGVFNEEWEFNCEPSMSAGKRAMIKLTGSAIEKDEL